MDILSKSQMTEEDIKLNFITPAIVGKGWQNKITMETAVTFTDGKINLKGNLAVRGSAKKADYLLYISANNPIAVVEAKDNNHSISYGLQQAMTYAQMLDLPFAYSSNGDGFAEHDFLTGTEREFDMEEFPTEAELLERLNQEKGITPAQEKIRSQPYYSSQKTYPPRYYQRIAINRTVDAIAQGQDRILLVMATGTGKTYTAFQIVYRLLQSGLIQKVLYLADRNILVDQSIQQDFAPLEKVIHKINYAKDDPKTIPAYQVYFSLYQQLTGSDDYGKAKLDYFISVGEKYPVIGTTSKLLSTGADCKMTKLIVLDEMIGSMTEFKQIIGRGTRLREKEGKMSFVVMDFRNVTRLFADPDWDGPIEIDPDYPPKKKPGSGPEPDTPVVPPSTPLGERPPMPYVDRNGCRVEVTHKLVSIYDTNGKLLRQESITDYTKSNILGRYASLENFVRQWSAEDKKAAIRDLLREQGIDLESMKADQNMSDVDDFDFICHVAFDKKPLTRRERANNVIKRDFLSKYSGTAREVLEALLDKYMNVGVYEIEKTEILQLDPFLKYGKPAKIASFFGGKAGYLKAVKELEQEIYLSEVV